MLKDFHLKELGPTDLLGDRKEKSLSTTDLITAVKLALLSKQFIRADKNVGSFLYVRTPFKNVKKTKENLNILSSVRSVLVDNGWGEVCFNVWKGELCVNLWENSLSSKEKHYFEGKEVTLD